MAANTVPPDRTRKSPQRILLVDDNPAQLSTYREILETAGFRVSTAGNGREALKRARRSRPDLVIADNLLPVMDGFTLCREWKQDPHLKNIPLILFMGTGLHPEDVNFGLSLGADRCLSKALEPDTLVNEIRNLLASGRGNPAPSQLRPPDDFLREHNRVLLRRLVERHREQDRLILEQVALRAARPGDGCLSTRREVYAVHRTRTALKKTKQLLALVVKAGRAAIYEHSLPPGTEPCPSTGWARILGYTRQELPSSKAFPDWVLARVHPDDRVLQEEAFTNFIDGRTPTYDLEIRMRHKSGKWIWVRNLSRAVNRTPDGRANHIVGVLLDVSDLKHLETTLAAELEKTRKAKNFLQGLSQAGQHIQLARTRSKIYAGFGHEVRQLDLDGTLFLLSDDQRYLHFTYTTLSATRLKMADKLTGLQAREYRFPVPVTGAFRRVLDNRDTFFLADGYELIQAALPKSIRPLAQPLRDMLSFRNIILSPLLVQNRVIGTVVIYGNSLSPEDLAAGSIFSQQISTALDNCLLMERLDTSRRTMKTLSQRLVEVQEQERGQISRDLHDVLGQNLTAVEINLNILQQHLSPHLGDEDRSRLQETIALVDATEVQAHELALEYRPSVLDDLGLIPTLEWYLDRFHQRTGILVRVEFPDQPRRYSSRVETVLYRITQEALTNVARHSGAARVSVRLAATGTQVTLTITDNGRGFDTHELTASRADRQRLGLIGMRERVHGTGGMFAITAAPGKGTSITVRIPLTTPGESLLP